MEMEINEIVKKTILCDEKGYLKHLTEEEDSIISELLKDSNEKITSKQSIGFLSKEEKSSFEKQVGGNFYRNMEIPIAEFIHKNKIPGIEAKILYYIVRWRKKNGIEDLEKAKHFIDLIIEMESNHEKSNSNHNSD